MSFPRQRFRDRLLNVIIAVLVIALVYFMERTLPKYHEANNCYISSASNTKRVMVVTEYQKSFNQQQVSTEIPIVKDQIIVAATVKPVVKDIKIVATTTKPVADNKKTTASMAKPVISDQKIPGSPANPLENGDGKIPGSPANPLENGDGKIPGSPANPLENGDGKIPGSPANPLENGDGKIPGSPANPLENGDGKIPGSPANPLESGDGTTSSSAEKSKIKKDLLDVFEKSSKSDRLFFTVSHPNQLNSAEWYKKNWKGIPAHCPYPSYLSQKYQNETWLPLFLHHLQQVNLTNFPSRSTMYDMSVACTRWWFPTPHRSFSRLPHRKTQWKEQKPDPQYKRPNCTFGQEKKPLTACSKIHQQLWKALDNLGVVWFPRSGSELGIVRDGSYIPADGDVDVYVDVPQEKLIKLLRNTTLNPKPTTTGSLKWVSAETHWTIKKCPQVHMVFNEWMVDEMILQTDNKRPAHVDLCTCFYDSAEMSCHKDAARRMYAQYGPSWFIRLYEGKFLDFPWAAKGRQAQSMLKKMVSPDGIVREPAVRKMDPKIKAYTPLEMQMVLAQLNVLQSYIYSNYKWPVDKNGAVLV